LSDLSGYIGAQTALAFLQRGFSVRGTVRSPSKGKYLDNLFKEFGSKWEWVIVDDLELVG
jgi:nucleoside-diphosphate-sugar epimerase